MDKKNNSGISMVEIIVSMVILALVMVGLVNVFVVGKTYTRGTGLRVSGGELGRFLLDPLQSDVREDQWFNTSSQYNLSIGTHTPAPQTINNVTYAYSYNVTDVPFGSTTVRKVVMRINWTE